MKNALALSIIVALVAATQLSAALQVGTQVRLDTNAHPGGIGGQFGAEDPGTNAPGFEFNDFITFCCELGQFISDDVVYTVSAIATQNTTGYTLGGQAAYLYTQFREGTLANFDYSSTNDANGLQYGIWLGMGYTPGVGPLTGTAASYSAYWNPTSWLAGFTSWGANNIGNVRVMQFGNNQDQLVLVPEPGSIMIWSLMGAGVAGAFYSRRRKIA